jgi:hypothetical protein
MRRKLLLFVIVPSIIVLMALTASSPIRNVSAKFNTPVVTATPSETEITQSVLIKAQISVATG